MWKKLSPETAHAVHAAKEFRPELLRKFIDANGFTRYCLPGPFNWKRLFETGRCYFESSWGANLREIYPVWMDHARVFKNAETGVVCLVAQPYAASLKSLAEQVIPWAHRHGLDASIFTPEHSWYYPGGTFLVVVYRPFAPISLPPYGGTQK
mgnify:CR=1 FL=1